MSTKFRQPPVAEREHLIESHLPLVRAIARRYAGRGESVDDLVQVGSIGLIRASDRFDPGRGVAFATFATPAIEGEIRRHLGDRTTSVRIPRDLQRMSGELQRCRAQLGASLGRAPTVEELATALGVEREDVERGLEAERAREASPEASELGEAGGEYEFRSSTDDRLLLGLAARALNERERRIVFLRFHADMTERDIAGELGISQAHVSRLLAGALTKLREELDDQKLAPDIADISDEPVISPPERGTKTHARAQKRRKMGFGGAAQTKIAHVGASQQKADLAAADSPHKPGSRAAARSKQKTELELPYHVMVRPEGESGWNAVVEELPGCEARGASPEEAVEHLRAAMETWLAAAMDDRRVMGPPKRQARKRKAATTASGRFLVRMPGELHQELALAAEREQVSLNRFVTDALAASLVPDGRATVNQPRASDETTSETTSDTTSETASVTPSRRKPGFRILLAANVIVIVLAAAAAVALLILALERGI